MPKIHPTAIVDPGARIADDVVIGPLCTVGPNVEIGSGTELVGQCAITGYTSLGENNKVFPFAVLGCPPQDLEWKGETSYLKIGSNNQFREGFTAHPGTKPGSETVIGNNCFFMNNSHIAHNCKVGNNVIMVNGAVAGGYAELSDRVLLSGNTAIHQFCRVGRLAMMGGVSAISKDLPPFMTCFSKTNCVSGLNLVGLKRNGFSKETIRALKDIHRIFFRSSNSVKRALEIVESNSQLSAFPEVQEFLDFVKSSKRGIVSSRIIDAVEDQECEE